MAEETGPSTANESGNGGSTPPRWWQFWKRWPFRKSLGSSRPHEDPNDPLEFQRQIDQITRLLFGMLTVGFVGAVVYSLQFFGDGDFLSVSGVGIGIGGASALVGAFLGFLFAIPRSLQTSRKDAAYSVNTNLEQISDWLTKILVGVGLIQLTELASWFRGLVEFLGPGLGGGQSGEIVAGTLVLYFSIGGFLLVYFWTRLEFARLVERAEKKDAVHVSDVASASDTSRDDVVAKVDGAVGATPKPR